MIINSNSGAHDPAECTISPPSKPKLPKVESSNKEKKKKKLKLQYFYESDSMRVGARKLPEHMLELFIQFDPEKNQQAYRSLGNYFTGASQSSSDIYKKLGGEKVDSAIKNITSGIQEGGEKIINTTTSLYHEYAEPKISTIYKQVESGVEKAKETVVKASKDTYDSTIEPYVVKPTTEYIVKPVVEAEKNLVEKAKETVVKASKGTYDSTIEPYVVKPTTEYIVKPVVEVEKNLVEKANKYDVNPIVSRLVKYTEEELCVRVPKGIVCYRNCSEDPKYEEQKNMGSKEQIPLYWKELSFKFVNSSETHGLFDPSIDKKKKQTIFLKVLTRQFAEYIPILPTVFSFMSPKL